MTPRLELMLREARCALRRAKNYPLFWLKARRKGSLEEHRKVFRALDYAPAAVDYMEASRGDLMVDFDVDAAATVVDVGAWRVDFSLQMSERYQCTVHAFEPHPPMFAELCSRAAGFEKIHCHSFGLAGKTRSAELSNLLMGASVYTQSPSYADVPKVEISLRDVAEVVDALELDRIDVIKINIEGGEFELLDRMIERDLTRRCRYIIVQFHRWFPRAKKRRARIQAGLEHTHRKLWDYPFIWEKWERRGV